jgi:hypothetical protein
MERMNGSTITPVFKDRRLLQLCKALGRQVLGGLTGGNLLPTGAPERKLQRPKMLPMILTLARRKKVHLIVSEDRHLMRFDCRNIFMIYKRKKLNRRQKEQCRKHSEATSNNINFRKGKL